VTVSAGVNVVVTDHDDKDSDQAALMSVVCPSVTTTDVAADSHC